MTFRDEVKIYVDPNLKKKLKSHCEDRGMKMSSFIVTLIKKALGWKK